MRKIAALIGASVLMLASAAPALACDGPPPPPCQGGIVITISVNALAGHGLTDLVDGTASKVTICHFGQNHDGDAIINGDS